MISVAARGQPANVVCGFGYANKDLTKVPFAWKVKLLTGLRVSCTVFKPNAHAEETTV